MKTLTAALAFAPVAGIATAHVPVTAAADQQAMLRSADPRLAGDKRLVYDFRREMLQGARPNSRSSYNVLADPAGLGTT